MVIRVVKEGTLPETVPYDGVCCYCKTGIECVQSDTFKKQSSDQRDASLCYVKCPTCGHDMLVTPTKNEPFPRMSDMAYMRE